MLNWRRASVATAAESTQALLKRVFSPCQICTSRPGGSLWRTATQRVSCQLQIVSTVEFVLRNQNPMLDRVRQRDDQPRTVGAETDVHPRRRRRFCSAGRSPASIIAPDHLHIDGT
jgi:hypothetical protein